MARTPTTGLLRTGLLLPLLLLTATACGTRPTPVAAEKPRTPEAIIFHDEARERRAGAVMEFLRDAGIKTRRERAELITEPSHRVLVYGVSGARELTEKVQSSLADFDEFEFKTLLHPGPEDLDVVVWMIGEPVSRPRTTTDADEAAVFEALEPEPDE